jgi:hypothetical protein
MHQQDPVGAFHIPEQAFVNLIPKLLTTPELNTKYRAFERRFISMRFSGSGKALL